MHVISSANLGAEVCHQKVQNTHRLLEFGACPCKKWQQPLSVEEGATGDLQQGLIVKRITG